MSRALLEAQLRTSSFPAWFLRTHASLINSSALLIPKPRENLVSPSRYCCKQGTMGGKSSQEQRKIIMDVAECICSSNCA